VRAILSQERTKKMAMKLYVGGLSYNVTDQELQDFFATEGKVASAIIIKDKFSGQSKGFGFVEMEDIKEGQNAIKSLNGKELNGRAIMVNEARPQEDRRPSGGGGGRGGYGGGGGGGRGGNDSNSRRY
jgi:RNA recognition motif-containing protein